jgi:hypothetical protein
MKSTCLWIVAVFLASCGGGDGDRDTGQRTGAQHGDADGYATGSLPTAATVQEHTDLQSVGKPPTQNVLGEAVVGRKATSDGGIPPTERTDRFAAGEEIHLAVKVQQPAPQARVRVAWYGPNDDLMREDAKRVSENDEYVSFSTEGAWDPGPYRAEIWLENDKIAEQRFAVAED